MNVALIPRGSCPQPSPFPDSLVVGRLVVGSLVVGSLVVTGVCLGLNIFQVAKIRTRMTQMALIYTDIHRFTRI